MHQIFWMLSLIPEGVLLWIINLALLTGVVGIIAGFFIKVIPFVNQYRVPVQIISIILLAGGLYFKGGYSNEMAWRAKVADLEEKVKAAEVKSAETNTKIDTKVKEKVKIVKEVQVVIQERIVKVKEKIDADCKIAPEAITILNDAARNTKGDGK